MIDKIIRRSFVENIIRDMLNYCESRYLKSVTVEGKADKTEILFIRNSRGNIVYKGSDK